MSDQQIVFDKDLKCVFSPVSIFSVGILPFFISAAFHHCHLCISLIMCFCVAHTHPHTHTPTHIHLHLWSVTADRLYNKTGH